MPDSLAGVDRRRATGLALAAAAAVGYGTGPLFAKDAYRAGIGWPELLAWRFVIAATLTWAFVAVRPSSRAALARVDRRGVVRIMAVGTIFTVNAAAYFAAVQLIPASLAALLLFTYPTFVAVLATRLGHVPPGPRPWVALVVTLAGAVLLIGGVQAGGNAVGLLLGILGPAAYALYTVLGARVAGERKGVTAVGRSGRAGPDVDSAVAAAILLSGTALAMVVLAIVVGARAAPWEMPGGAWFGILGVAIFATVIAMQAGYAGVARIGSSQAAIVGMLDPVTVVVLAAILLGERYDPIQLVGGAIVVVGVLIAVSASMTGMSPREPSAGEPRGVEPPAVDPSAVEPPATVPA
jgi:drug/metabolite transporter (DMT)-like permease